MNPLYDFTLIIPHFFSGVHFGGRWSLDNEGIQEDPTRRRAEEKKVWENCEQTLKRPAAFLPACRVWKLIWNLMKKTSCLDLLGRRITETIEHKVIWFLPTLTLPRCLPRVGALLLDFMGCFASGQPGFQAPGQCYRLTEPYLRITARKRQLVRHLNTTHVWDLPYHIHIRLWFWQRTPAPKKRLLRSWPCGLVRFIGIRKIRKDAVPRTLKEIATRL